MPMMHACLNSKVFNKTIRGLRIACTGQSYPFAASNIEEHVTENFFGTGNQRSIEIIQYTNDNRTSIFYSCFTDALSRASSFCIQHHCEVVNINSYVDL